MGNWEQIFYSLIKRASTDLPPDVEHKLKTAAASEDTNSNARQTLDVMLENVRLARTNSQPLCQDTGALLFYLDVPRGFNHGRLREAAEKAVATATRDGLLRQNAVDPVTGRNTGNNLGAGSPAFHFQQQERSNVHVSLILKGGGCENVGRQYSLPDADLRAERDLEGVRRCLLDAVYQAQGLGCAPGVLGVCIGGDRASGYAESKRQLLRRFGARNKTAELANLETRVLREANELAIGPMGFGGKTTILEVFIGALCRVPASYFVSISYMCWAYRRHGLTAAKDGMLDAWDFPTSEL